MENMDALKFAATAFAIATLLGFFVEAFTEFFVGLAFDYVPDKWKNLKRLIAVLVATGFGLWVTIHYQVDLIASLIRVFGQDHPNELHGMILTGLAVGRGAEFIHSIFKRFFPQAQ